jgi:hypothetical protein
MLLVIALVALCYCGGKLCPAVLRQNKEMLLGVAVGMALCSFMDLRMEGFDSQDYMECMQGGHSTCETTRVDELADGVSPGLATMNWMTCDTDNTRQCRLAYEATQAEEASEASATAPATQEAGTTQQALADMPHMFPGPSQAPPQLPRLPRLPKLPPLPGPTFRTTQLTGDTN